MTQLNQVYKCSICGNIVQILHTGAGQLVCCGVPMELMTEKTEDEGLEKHVPVISKTDNGFIVKIGQVAHPMEEAHFIEWIELIADGKSYRQYLKAGDKPEATFCLKANQVSAREYCSVHGLWQG